MESGSKAASKEDAQPKQPREKKVHSGGSASLKRVGDKDATQRYKTYLKEQLEGPTLGMEPFNFDPETGLKVFQSKHDEGMPESCKQHTRLISRAVVMGAHETVDNLIGSDASEYNVLVPGRTIWLVADNKKRWQELTQEANPDYAGVCGYLKTIEGQTVQGSVLVADQKVQETRPYDAMLFHRESFWILESKKTVIPESTYLYCYRINYRLDKSTTSNSFFVPIPTEILNEQYADMMQSIKKRDASLYCKLTFKYEEQSKELVIPRVPPAFFRNSVYTDEWAYGQPEPENAIQEEPQAPPPRVEAEEDIIEEAVEDVIEPEPEPEAEPEPKPEPVPVPEPAPAPKKRGRKSKDPEAKPAAATKPKDAPKKRKQRFYEDEAGVAGSDEDEEEDMPRRRKLKRAKRAVEIDSDDDDMAYEDYDSEDDMFINDGEIEYEDSSSSEAEKDSDMDISSVEEEVGESPASEGTDNAYVCTNFIKLMEKAGQRLEDAARNAGMNIAPPISATDTWPDILADNRKFQHLAECWLLLKFNPNIALFRGQSARKTTQELVRDLIGATTGGPDPVTERTILQLLNS